MKVNKIIVQGPIYLAKSKSAISVDKNCGGNSRGRYVFNGEIINVRGNVLNGIILVPEDADRKSIQNIHVANQFHCKMHYAYIQDESISFSDFAMMYAHFPIEIMLKINIKK